MSSLYQKLDILEAVEQKIAEIEKVIVGDVDKDGKITVSDVVALRKAIMSGSASADLLAVGDLDNDGKLTVSDVVALRKKIMQG